MKRWDQASSIKHQASRGLMESSGGWLFDDSDLDERRRYKDEQKMDLTRMELCHLGIISAQ
jgi:heme oxygenase